MESMGQTPAVDVEHFKDSQDLLHGQTPIDGPTDDVEIFLPRFEAIEDSIEQKLIFTELTREQAEVPAIQLLPKPKSLDVFDPTRPEVAAPVIANPLLDGGLAQVSLRALAFDPLVAKRFHFALGKHATDFHHHTQSLSKSCFAA